MESAYSGHLVLAETQGVSKKAELRSPCPRLSTTGINISKVSVSESGALGAPSFHVRFFFPVSSHTVTSHPYLIWKWLQDKRGHYVAYLGLGVLISIGGLRCTQLGREGW